MEKQIDIAQWTRDPHFYGSIELLLSIKSFDLQAIRARYLASRQKQSGRSGSVERRPVGLGGFASVRLSAGGLTVTNLVKHLKEPRGLARSGDRLALSLENEVLVFEAGRLYRFSLPWFSYIHTLSFHPSRPGTLLVTSSGFDALFEYDYQQEALLWQWFAWDHGLNQAQSPQGGPLYLTRHLAEAERYRAKGLEYRLIADPQRDVLPTAQRAAFINTAHYDGPDQILITLFHEGSLRLIERETGSSRVLLQGLKNPHGGQRSEPNRLMVTNTGGGELWLQQEQQLTRYDFSNLAAKAPEMQGAEWLQNSIAMGDWLISIDANRNALVILDPHEARYDLIPFDAQWAVQDLILKPSALPDLFWSQFE